MRRADSLEKTLILGKTDGITDSMDMSLIKLWEMVKDREACPWCCKESDTTWQLNDNNNNS